MPKNNMYYSLVENETSAVLNIFGDITSYAWEEYGEMSSVLLSEKLEELGDNVSVIDVYINSYGGEVAEGLAIYNALKRHKAKIRTHVDGFACSIASVIFMAGEERIMPSTSCLMIHNPWVMTMGNAEELRKTADDLDIMADCSINAYMENINISEDELRELMDNESWISSKDAIEMGFATSSGEEEKEVNPNQSIKGKIIAMLLDSNGKKQIPKEVQLDNKNKENKTIDDGNPSNKVTDNMLVTFLMNLEKER